MAKGSDRRLWRQLARAPEAVAGHLVAGPHPGSAELPRAARRTLRRCRSRAEPPPRGHFNRAVAPLDDTHLFIRQVCTLQGIVLDMCGGVYVAETVPLHVGVVARQMELDQGHPTHDGATNADAVHVHLEEAVVALAAVEDLRTSGVVRTIRG